MPNGQPNILIIWGDDIGQSNLSCYTHGLMGYKTPNIDRIAREGILFTDYYGEQSCTAGRSAFISCLLFKSFHLDRRRLASRLTR
jgi:arylsulfatase A-like enzyme